MRKKLKMEGEGNAKSNEGGDGGNNKRGAKSGQAVVGETSARPPSSMEFEIELLREPVLECAAGRQAAECKCSDQGCLSTKLSLLRTTLTS